MISTEGKSFDKIDFTIENLEKATYENCSFTHCNFSTADLSNMRFIESHFVNCNLSNAEISNSAFTDVIFKDCKMLGINFEDCNTFSFFVSFEGCVLDYASFYKIKLRKTNLKSCSLIEVDFTECDLSQSIFEDCDLAGAIFVNSILEKTDFRTAHHYSFDLDKNKIKKAKFAQSGIAGLLSKYEIEIDRLR